MKERILKLLRKDKENPSYYKTFKKIGADTQLWIEDHSNEYTYMSWGGLKIHYNAFTDKLVVYCDGKRWEE